MRKLSDRLLLALGRYYMWRARSKCKSMAEALSNLSSRVGTRGSSTHHILEQDWDKGETGTIALEAKAAKWYWQSCDGVFWFYAANGRPKTKQIRVDEFNWDVGGKVVPVPKHDSRNQAEGIVYGYDKVDGHKN